MGGLAAMNIPKESSPAVKLGMISITTVYPWTNPIDMDSLVSEKIYKEVKDIDWIDKINSNSSLGVSSLTLTLKTSADVKDVMSDVRNAVSKVSLPTDAKTPIITEIETDTNRAFSIFLFSKIPNSSPSFLFDRAIKLQKELEQVSWVNKVDLSAGWWQRAIDGWGWNDSTYDVQFIIPDEKLSSLGLSLSNIASTIQSYNRDQPIGNFAIGEKKYDFRIEGKNRLSFDFLHIPIALPKWWNTTLAEIAVIERKYKNEAQRLVVPGGDTSKSFTYVWLTVNKTDSISIFQASDAAKKRVEESFQKPEFEWYGYMYGIDVAETIRDDYNDLFHEALTTLILVFIAMYLFVWFRDSLFASLTLPLAFLSTFLLLYYAGYTMNFLTNFSLILSFGIAVDTIIVIVQAASAKIRVGYEPRTAIMLALREYSAPIIAWVMTTIVVFIPMMTLPGILGKFLSYIPITIFGVLATGLVLALTVNSALYLLFVRPKKEYVDNSHATEYATDDEKELLIIERQWKIRIEDAKVPLRIRTIHLVTEWYKKTLRNFLEHKKIRRLSIFLPVILLVLSFIFLAPIVGLEVFPSDDNNIINITVEWPVGQRTEVMAKSVSGIAEVFSGYSEIDYVTINTNQNTTTIWVQLINKKIRKANGEMDVFTLEKLFLEKLHPFEEKGLKVVVEVQKWWPPGSQSVWLKLVAEEAEDLSELIRVSKVFETHLKTIPGTKNVSRSSNDTPWQFIFTLKKDVLTQYNIPAAIVYSTITQFMNGVTVWTVENNGEDMNIVLKTSQFQDEVRLEDILSIPLTVGNTVYHIGDFIDTTVTNATARISREDGKIQITVGSDLDFGIDSVSTQSKFEEFAKAYAYPKGISYIKWWETQENSDLIRAVLSAFFISIIVIFAILTLQFNSFGQPLIVLYSVIMSLPVVMLGLLLTGNQFSLPFGIGFIAFTGIAVNHGIILIDAINQNLKKWMEWINALVEAGSSRLEPMTLTTLTTALWMLPIALKDRFWSGMGFTIIFGIITASFLTLFVVKGLYYELFMKKEDALDK